MEVLVNSIENQFDNYLSIQELYHKYCNIAAETKLEATEENMRVTTSMSVAINLTAIYIDSLSLTEPPLISINTRPVLTISTTKTTIVKITKRDKNVIKTSTSQNISTLTSTSLTTGRNIVLNTTGRTKTTENTVEETNLGTQC